MPAIYYITEDANPKNSAEAISAQAMGKLTNSIAQPFETKSLGWLGSSTKITKAPQDTPNEIILLAHTDSGRPPSTIGGKTPQELANDFAKMITKITERTKVTDIFLVSCEAGMGNPSLAQQFAAAMVGNGFSKIKIHAVAHPVGKLIGGGVEVTTRAGTVTGGTIGQVTGYFYGNQESKEYHQYISIKATHQEDRTAEEKILFNQLKAKYSTFDKNQAVIVNLVTDLQEMRAPYNTFTANGPEATISADIAIALSFLKQKKNTLITLNQGETDVTKALDNIITQLKANPTFTHVQIISQLKTVLKDHTKTLTSWASSALGVNPITKYLEAYANELNVQLNHINKTSHQMPQEKERSTSLTEASPLLGGISQTNNKDIPTQLREYAAERKKEWGYHWDFLYLKTLSFWISDSISSIAKNMGLIEDSTDYLNIKYRDTKVSAAEKLANIIEGNINCSVLTVAEEKALREGRLGSIVGTVLDDILFNNIEINSEAHHDGPDI